ncbi:MAG: recombinase family protein [bacterium]
MLFWKVDRLSRNYGDFGEIEKVFDWGYELISSTETMEATYTGRLLFRILSSFAIYESDKNSARQSLQRIGAFIRKKFKSIRTKKGIFGYKAGKNKNPKINIEEAEVVKFIYKKYLELHVGKKPSKENIYKTIASEIRCSFMN